MTCRGKLFWLFQSYCTFASSMPRCENQAHMTADSKTRINELPAIGLHCGLEAAAVSACSAARELPLEPLSAAKHARDVRAGRRHNGHSLDYCFTVPSRFRRLRSLVRRRGSVTRSAVLRLVDCASGQTLGTCTNMRMSRATASSKLGISIFRRALRTRPRPSHVS